jgi:hypothetical protein
MIGAVSCRIAAGLLVGLSIAPAFAEQRESVPNLDQCIRAEKNSAGFVITNICKQPIVLEFITATQPTPRRAQLVPGQSMVPLADGFGSACPVGYTSDVPVRPENAAVFQSGTPKYRCVPAGPSK